MVTLLRDALRAANLKKIGFVTIIAVPISDSYITNLIETRICTSKLNYSLKICTDQMSKDLEDEIQPHAAQIIMAKTFIEAFLPAMLSFFIGPWSDSNGRKPFLLCSIAGYVVSYTIWGILASFNEIPAIYFLAVTIPSTISGGYVAFFTSIFCYIGDVTTVKNRGFRMVILQASIMMGFLFGSLFITLVYKTAGTNAHTTIFLMASGCCSVAFCYALCVLPESVNCCHGNQKRLLDFSHIKNMMGTVLKKRPNKGRAVILILASICTISVAIYQGEMSVKYLSLRKALSWSLENFNDFSAVLCLTMALTSLLGMWIFNQILQIHEIYIALVISSLSVISEILVAISKTNLLYMTSVFISCFSILTGPVIRSEMSKIVSRNGLGKVFAFLASLEALTPLAASPIYTLVYSSLLEKSPLAVYFMSAAFWSFNAILVMCLIGIYNINGVPYDTEEDNEIVYSDEVAPINA